MSKIDEAFERFCSKEGITSEQYKGDIKPAFEAGYRSGAASKPKDLGQAETVQLDGEQDRRGLDLAD